MLDVFALKKKTTKKNKPTKFPLLLAKFYHVDWLSASVMKTNVSAFSAVILGLYLAFPFSDSEGLDFKVSLSPWLPILFCQLSLVSSSHGLTTLMNVPDSGEPPGPSYGLCAFPKNTDIKSLSGRPWDARVAKPSPNLDTVSCSLRERLDCFLVKSFLILYQYRIFGTGHSNPHIQANYLIFSYQFPSETVCSWWTIRLQDADEIRGAGSRSYISEFRVSISRLSKW